MSHTSMSTSHQNHSLSIEHSSSEQSSKKRHRKTTIASQRKDNVLQIHTSMLEWGSRNGHTKIRQYHLRLLSRGATRRTMLPASVGTWNSVNAAAGQVPVYSGRTNLLWTGGKKIWKISYHFWALLEILRLLNASASREGTYNPPFKIISVELKSTPSSEWQSQCV